MKLSESTEIVETIFYAYPNWLKPTVNVEKLVIVWHQSLSDYDFGAVKKRLVAYIAENKFAPTIADIIGAGDVRDGTPHPDGGVWLNGKRVVGVQHGTT